MKVGPLFLMLFPEMQSMATERYNPRDAEPRWQVKWSEDKVFETDNADPREKYYVLEMFPYPSGAGLHVGHPLGYIASDIMADMGGSLRLLPSEAGAHFQLRLKRASALKWPPTKKSSLLQAGCM